MANGGFAVDAAVAALICGGAHHSQAAGIGGGVIMTIYSKATGEAVALMAREIAPGYAHKDMFDGDQLAAQLGTNDHRFKYVAERTSENQRNS
jgi:gamma-glutamyltranspeptidase/glutathione hydrolase/leukotriene-C4 hydrolase